MGLASFKHFAQMGVARFASWVERQQEFAGIHELTGRGLLVIGRHTYGRPKVWMHRGSECRVVIGAFCSISPGVQIIPGGIHPTNWVSTYPFRARWGLPGAWEDGIPTTKGDVEIGCDVWIGSDAMILSGVTIGHGAVVSARAVVTRDIRPYSIVAGVPAREVGMRFTEEQVAELLQVKWWEWDDRDILAAVPLLSSPEIESFLNTVAARRGS